MEVNNQPNGSQGVNDVLDDVNNVAGQVNENAARAQNAMGTIFFALIQRLLNDARDNSSSGA